MASTLSEDMQVSLNIVDDIVSKWVPVACALFVRAPNSRIQLRIAGSSFFFDAGNGLFLVTANHVAEELMKHDERYIYIDDRLATLGTLKFSMNKKSDLAVAFLSADWLSARVNTSVKTARFDTSQGDFKENSLYLLIGFPGSKNKIHLARPSPPHALAYTALRRLPRPKTRTTIDFPITFEFDKKKASGSDGSRIDPGKFNGVSGGPMFEIIKRERAGHPVISTRLAGVFSGWDKNTRELICCRPEAVKAQIELSIEKGIWT